MTVKISFRDFAELDQAGQARRVQRQPAGRVRRQPGLPARRRAREGRADPPARPSTRRRTAGTQSYTPETLQQFEWTDDGTDVRRGHAVGRRPDRPVRRRVRQQEEAGRGGRRPRVAEDVRRLRRRAGQAARVAAGRRAGDHARQQGPVRTRSTSGAGSRAPTRRRRTSATGSSSRTARRSTRRATSSRWRSSRSGRTRATSARPTRTTRATRTTPAIAFGKGQGALLIAGNWNAATARDGLGDDASSSTCRPARAATWSTSARRASRCTSRPRRSSRTSRRRTSTGSPGRRPARSSSTPSRCRRRPTAPPSRATRSARRSRTAGTSSSRTAA